MRLNYIGNSDIREVKRADMLARGLSDPGRDLIWTKANGYELDVPNDVAAFLLAFFGDFVTDDALDFGTTLNDAFGGRLAGVAELQFAQSNSTSTLASLFGCQVEVEAVGRPFRVAFSIPSQNSTAGQGAQWIVQESLDGGQSWTTVDSDFPFDGGSTAANLPIRRMLECTRIPPPGLVIYRLQFARFTSGVGTAGCSAVSPGTLSVTEL